MKCDIKLSQYLTEYNCDIHRAVYQDTPWMLDVLKATKAVAKFVNKISKALKQLKDTCKRYNIKFKKIVNPPPTNSIASKAKN